MNPCPDDMSYPIVLLIAVSISLLMTRFFEAVASEGRDSACDVNTVCEANMRDRPGPVSR